MQRAAHQELGGQIVDLLGLLLLAGVAGVAAALHDLVAHHQGQGLIELLRRGVAHIAGELGVQLVLNAVFDLVYGHPLKLQEKHLRLNLAARGESFNTGSARHGLIFSLKVTIPHHH